MPYSYLSLHAWRQATCRGLFCLEKNFKNQIWDQDQVTPPTCMCVALETVTDIALCMARSPTERPSDRVRERIHGCMGLYT